MRKTLLSLFLGLAGWSAWAQGTVILQNGSASYLISTNAAWIGQGIGVTAKTPALAFDYALLLANYGGPVPSSNPLDAAWSGAVLTGVNFAITAGGISGQGGAAVLLVRQSLAGALPLVLTIPMERKSIS
jgi:hypothetical protein